ncbi:hypothetical protein PQX77_005792 [Marasmius sp. AFHP31]|nr:hypothetical protein PQX77_005792 [Marasmius sp. AFHP31]
MRLSAAGTAISLSFIAGAVAQLTIDVAVGAGGLQFNPTDVNATEGDTIRFIFQAKNHSVVQSTFDNPCTKKDGGLNSGFQFIEGEPKTWEVKVNGTDPMWFYCSQKEGTDHCKSGMVFAINPTETNTFEAFQNKAKGTGISQQTFDVAVGAGGLQFNPTSITGAKEGDTIRFTFQAKNHSAVQSTFNDPCTSKDGGLNSGFQFIEGEPKTWEVTVNGTDPMWFYCSQTEGTDHCKAGMVFAVNPTETNTFEAFQNKAKGDTGISRQTFNVAVGAGGLQFNPTSITGAKEGDTIKFTFQAKNHSTVQSTFDNPCAKKDGGLDSGFQFIEGEPKTWEVTVNGTDPLWFYCSQTSNNTDHCKSGMVFAVNPTVANTFEAFQVKAKSTGSGSGSGSGSAGGNTSDPGSNGNSTADTVFSTSIGQPPATTSGEPPATTSSAGNNDNNGAVGLKGVHTFGLLSMAGIVLGLVL